MFILIKWEVIKLVNLIKVELKKIFKKKGIILVSILFIVYFIFTCITALEFRKAYTDFYYTDTYEIEERQEKINAMLKENETLDLSDEGKLTQYVSNLSEIEIEELKNTYLGDYDIEVIDTYIANLISEANTYKYLYKDEASYSIKRNEADEYINKLKNNDWKYFVNLDIEGLKQSLGEASDEASRNSYQELIYLAQYRIDNDISYVSSSSLNEAIRNIEDVTLQYYSLLAKDTLTSSEEKTFLEVAKTFQKNHYIIDNKVESADVESSVSNYLVNFNSYFSIWVILYLILICGSIISEEFNKGTIKYLLTNPYKRSTILTSKILTVLLLLPVILLFMFLVIILIGGIFLGFDSLSLPVLIYNSTTGFLLVKNLFLYSFMKILFQLPIYLTIIVFSLMMGVLTLQTSATSIFAFLLYIISSMMQILSNYPKLFIILPFYHWDFSYLIDFQTNPYFNINAFLSFIIIAFYIVMMGLVAYRRFNRIDIKNI